MEALGLREGQILRRLWGREVMTAGCAKAVPFILDPAVISLGILCYFYYNLAVWNL